MVSWYSPKSIIGHRYTNDGVIFYCKFKVFDTDLDAVYDSVDDLSFSAEFGFGIEDSHAEYHIKHSSDIQSNAHPLSGERAFYYETPPIDVELGRNGYHFHIDNGNRGGVRRYYHKTVDYTVTNDSNFPTEIIGDVGWNIDCGDKRVRVFVNDLEIPTTFVQTHESRDGPSSYNQMTEVKFPSEWEGVSVVEWIDAFDPDNYDGYDRVLIQRQNAQSGEWMDHQYGFVRNVGGTEERGILAMWVADPSMLTTGVEYGRDFQNATGDDILSHLKSVFNSETVFNISNIILPEGGLEGGDTSDTSTSVFSSSAVDSVSGGNEHLFHPSFKANRDTLADAFNWVAEKSDTDWWFDYSGENLVLFFGQRGVTTWTSDHVDAVSSNGNPPNEVKEINIISNEALTEITPVNTMKVGGVTGRSILGHNIKQLSNEYPYARVEYPPLVQRAGQYVSGPMKNIDASTVEEAENVAKEKLRDAILNSGHGEITLYGTPEMEVGDEIHAIPECGDEYIADVEPFTFQITDLEHTKKALEEYVTEATVAPRVNEDLIEITESRMKDQQNQ